MSNFSIRPYRESDYPEIHSWWVSAGEIAPLPGEMVEDGTHVLEIDGAPAMSLTVYLTQSRAVSYFELFIARPGLEKALRHEAGEALWFACYSYARVHGFEGVTMYARNDKLAARYEELGMTRALEGMTALHKRLGGIGCLQ